MPEPKVDPRDEEQALVSQVGMFDNSRKTEYLGWRACCFSIREACQLVPISEAQVRRWRNEDPEFARFEGEGLQELQRDYGPALLRMGFLRIVKLFMNVDYKLLSKASLLGVDVGPAMDTEGAAVMAGLTNREFQYLCKIRSEYSPAAMLAFHRALEPETAGGDGGALGVVQVIINNQIVESTVARQAAGQALLDQWKERKMLPEGVEKDEPGQDGE